MSSYRYLKNPPPGAPPPPPGPATVDWRTQVQLVGTGAQFEQIPAGAVWHVRETCTIKIVGIVPPGDIVVPP